ncbi:MAG TPA: histidine phosphatase family protein [Spirochaetota bacterium]|nr:histidine phosphatase family protein [Spirochaetota bacterium]
MVIRGCLRTYFVKDTGAEITSQFFIETQVVSSFESAMTQTPSRLFIEAIEDSIIGFIRIKDLESLIKNNSAAREYFGRFIMTRLIYYMNQHARFISADPDYVIPGGESVRQRYERTINAVQKIIGANRDRRIILVIHGGGLDSLFRHALEIPLTRSRNFSLMNASMNVLSVEGDAWKVETWGDVSHLADIGALDDF